MDPLRHRTLKKSPTATAATAATAATSHPLSRAEYAALAEERFTSLLRSGAEEAYMRPWHRIERGLRLNRIRIFIEEISPQFDMTKEEKDDLFTVLQKAHDQKRLNTLKVVQYDPEKQRILAIRGLELKRTAEGILKGSLGFSKDTTNTTRKKKKTDEPIVRVDAASASSASSAAASASSHENHLNEKNESKT